MVSDNKGELQVGQSVLLAATLSNKTARIHLQVKSQNIIYIHNNLMLPTLLSFIGKYVLRGDADHKALWPFHFTLESKMRNWPHHVEEAQVQTG